jgi:hypothetical protein
MEILRYQRLDAIIDEIIKKENQYIIKAHLIDENKNSIPYTFYTTNHIQSPIIYVINRRYARGFIMPSPPQSKKYKNISNERPIPLDDFMLVRGYDPNIPIPYYMDGRSIIVARTYPTIHGKRDRIADEIRFEGNCIINIVKKIEEYNSYVLYLEDADIDSLNNLNKYLLSPTHLVDIIDRPKNRLYRYGWFIDVIDNDTCKNYELYPLKFRIFEIFGFAKF